MVRRRGSVNARCDWPTRFRSALGRGGAATLAALERMPHDPNRFLKLRRIAIECLAAVA
jgi:hypothetical protein